MRFLTISLYAIVYLTACDGTAAAPLTDNDITKRVPLHDLSLPLLGRQSTESSRTVKACDGLFSLNVPRYETSGTLKTKLPTVKTYGYVNPNVLQDLSFDGNRPYPTNTADYATEHILELQMASQFFGYVDTQVGKTVPDYSPGKSGKVKFCPAIKILWMNVPAESEFTMDNTKRQPLDHLMAIYPGNLAHLSEMSLLDKNVNSFKERLFSNGDITAKGKLEGHLHAGQSAAANVKHTMTVLKYMDNPTVTASFKAEKERFQARIKALDEVELPKMKRVDGNKKAYGTWQPMGLEQMWNTFIRQKCTSARAKAISYIDSQLEALKNGYVSTSMKQQAEKQAALAPPDTQLKDLIATIEALEKVWATYKTTAWPNPF